VAASCAASIVPSLGPSLHPPSLCDPLPGGPEDSGSKLDSDINDVEMDGREDTSDREEDDTDTFIEASRSEPKVKEDICLWKELREQLKSDWLEGQKKKETPTYLNKLTILQNFATLHIKGVGCIAMSEKIVQLWKDGVGEYFACQI